MSDYGPIPGSKIFNALKDEKCIIMACNARVIPGLAKGIIKAAKKMDAAVLFELARTECNQHVGYTGLTPQTYSDGLNAVTRELQFDMWALHADHIQVPKGTPEDIQDVKGLIDAQIAAGYTSFAIDASYLFNFEGQTPEEELAPNINVTIELANYIKEKMNGQEFGLEVEVGEIGKKGAEGLVLTTPEEAVAYIRKLTEAGVKPNVLAIANGSVHGNVYDERGNLIPLSTVNVEQTKAVVKALRDNGFNVRIAQHGITGTPLELIDQEFPKGDIIKGNVATHWQNIFFDAIKLYDPVLYKEMFDWVIANKPIEGKKDVEIFGKNSKYALKVYFDRINSLNQDCVDYIEAAVYAEALKFFKAFNAKGTASKVRAFMQQG